MIFRPARESDFLHLETFVWQAIFPAFDRPELSPAQKAENDALVETARSAVVGAIDERDAKVFVAIENRSQTLAGYIIADAAPRAYAEIRALVVKRSFWGKKVGARLLAEATNFIGHDRAVSLEVRIYNDRARSFFEKHGFIDTGEITGNHAIPRTLMLREAFETVETPTMEDKKKTGYAEDFPSSANEPVFEALPDYRLATDDDPLFATGENKLSTSLPEDQLFDETTLDEKTLTELEAFIARARALKGTSAPPEGFSPVSPKPKNLKPESASKGSGSLFGDNAFSQKKTAGAYDPRSIPFEVDFGGGRVEETNTSRPGSTTDGSENSEPTTAELKAKPSFEFAFSGPVVGSTENDVSDTPTEDASVTQREEPTARAEKKAVAAPVSVAAGSVRKTKLCPDCETELPTAARFCFSCGYPQPEEEDLVPAGAQAPGEDFLVLEELPVEPVIGLADIPATAGPGFSSGEGNGSNRKPDATRTKRAPGSKAPHRPSGALSTKKYTMAELKQAFREHFQERVIAYFGAPKLKRYSTTLEESNNFQQLRDGSLTNLLTWINGGERSYASVAHRINGTMADLTEYFIVEVAGELSGKVLPQRLLRHQSVNWETVDLFKLVMDYLNFEAETERVYTDFVAMPARALRNATNAFLRAGKDERIFFICDQSLISQAKNGFAVTDAGLYWKNVLQPAGSALFTTMEKVTISQGHLEVDGQFFNAGARLNLKMAVLLDKLRRMG